MTLDRKVALTRAVAYGSVSAAAFCLHKQGRRTMTNFAWPAPDFTKSA